MRFEMNGLNRIVRVEQKVSILVTGWTGDSLCSQSIYTVPLTLI